MLEDRPILKDRLIAGAVFSGIAIAAVSGFELVITGGLDPIMPRIGAAAQRTAPAPAPVVVVTQDWPSAAVTPLSRLGFDPLEPAAPQAVSTASLDGGYAEAPRAEPPALSEAEISAEIDALYEATAEEMTAPPVKPAAVY